jgi:hypothetical protein
MNDMLVNDLLARLAAAPSPAGMWAHPCEKERDLVWTGCGQECSWCGAKESP